MIQNCLINVSLAARLTSFNQPVNYTKEGGGWLLSVLTGYGNTAASGQRSVPAACIMTLPPEDRVVVLPYFAP